MISLVLYQPDIPQNTGTMLRLCACLGVDVHVIEPTGFDLSDRALRRAGMDYLGQVSLIRHLSWEKFVAWRAESGHRLVLATTKGALPYTDFGFASDDLILMGRESAGVPERVHEAARARVTIPMAAGMRSLNVATAAAMMLGEALTADGRISASRLIRASQTRSTVVETEVETTRPPDPDTLHCVAAVRAILDTDRSNPFMRGHEREGDGSPRLS